MGDQLTNNNQRGKRGGGEPKRGPQTGGEDHVAERQGASILPQEKGGGGTGRKPSERSRPFP